ncbi:MAG: hypothetical protein HYY84_18100 [Deltaproteobacteria bacterium]|nr:hypothetical protein [Deltaproteobacteria bacterium]
MNGVGDALVVWEQDIGTALNIWARRFDSDAGAWSARATIRSLAWTDAGLPICCSRVGLDPLGNGFAVWQQTSGGTQSIMAARYRLDLKTWEAPAAIQGTDSPSSPAPGTLFGGAEFGMFTPTREHELAVDGLGGAVVVWLHAIDGGRDVWANRFTGDAGWGNAGAIEPIPDAGSSVGKPSVGADGFGGAAAVWVRDYAVWWNLSSSDGGWAAAVPLFAMDAGELGGSWPSNARIVTNAAGARVVVWNQSFATRQVWVRRLIPPSVDWLPAETLADVSDGFALEPAVAIDAEGNALVAWNQRADGGHMQAWARRYAADAGIGPAAAVATVSPLASFAYAPPPVIALDGAGNGFLTLLLYGDLSSPPQVSAARYSRAASTWSSPTVIGGSEGVAFGPSAAAGAAGTALVVWGSEVDDVGYRVWENRFTADAGWRDAGAVWSPFD